MNKMDRIDRWNRLVGIGIMVLIAAWILILVILFASVYQSIQVPQAPRSYVTPAPTHTVQWRP